jgi:anti-sigma factor RsiW
MHNCQSLDPLVTPFVDGELSDADRLAVEAHLRACPPCHSRVAAERAVHQLLHTRRSSLCQAEAPDALHARCAAFVNPTEAERRAPNAERRTANANLRTPNPELRTLNPAAARAGRLVPFALAASLVTIVGGAFVYQATDKSARVLAAELVADHAKCFALNGALGTRQLPAAVEQSMAASFDWRMHLPENPARAGLELVGARPCLYGEGRVAHIMYRHDGRPVSLFMLPDTARAQQLVEVLGHEAAIWCEKNRTFVLVAREPRPDVERMASFVQASLH